MTQNCDTLALSAACSVRALNAGLFISRGTGTHPTRIIDSHELIFVKEGSLTMWEEDQTFPLTAGRTLHLFPGRQHGALTPMHAGLKFYWIHFEAEADLRETASSAVIEVPQINRVRHPERLENLFRFFLDGQESGIVNATSANLLMMLMLVEAAQPSLSETDALERANVVAARAHTYISMYYDNPISPGRIAEALGYNPDYLGRVYRKVYGCTLTDAIHRRRIDVARRHLMDSTMTVEQIAQACGFSDPDYFRRVFRRYAKTSPGSYRSGFARVHVNTQ